jgi:hypothetical protein
VALGDLRKQGRTGNFGKGLALSPGFIDFTPTTTAHAGDP